MQGRSATRNYYRRVLARAAQDSRGFSIRQGLLAGLIVAVATTVIDSMLERGVHAIYPVVSAAIAVVVVMIGVFLKNLFAAPVRLDVEKDEKLEEARGDLRRLEDRSAAEERMRVFKDMLGFAHGGLAGYMDDPKKFPDEIKGWQAKTGVLLQDGLGLAEASALWRLGGYGRQELPTVEQVRAQVEYLEALLPTLDSRKLRDTFDPADPRWEDFIYTPDEEEEQAAA